MGAGRIGGAVRRAMGNRGFLGVLVGVTVFGAVFAAAGLGAAPAPSGCKGELLVWISGVTDGLGAKGHKDWIEVLSYNWGIARPAGEAVKVEEFTIVKLIDKSSPLLYKALGSGDPLQMTVAVCGRGAGASDFKEYVVYSMEDVRVVSMGIGTDVESFVHMEDVGLADYRHLEEVSFTYQKITLDYTAQGGAVESLECGGAEWNDCTWATP